jgi:hypothetical protein
MPIRNPRWPPPQDRLTLSTMGKMFKCETKLYLIVHWIVLYRGGSRGGCTRHATPLKLEKIWFFGIKSWFFTRNTPTIFAPPSARRNFFKCARPNLKSWICPCSTKFFCSIWNSRWRLRHDLVWHQTLWGKCFKRHLGQLKLNLETELRRNVVGASGERYRLLRSSGY